MLAANGTAARSGRPSILRGAGKSWGQKPWGHFCCKDPLALLRTPETCRRASATSCALIDVKVEGQGPPCRETGNGALAERVMATVTLRSTDVWNLRLSLWETQLRLLKLDSFDSFEQTCTSFHTLSAVPHPPSPFCLLACQGARPRNGQWPQKSGSQEIGRAHV